MLAGKKLLLADDSITIQKVVDLTFADEGVTVLSVNNGREAIEKLREFGPDIVLADVFMPQMGGLELCEQIKQNDQLKHIPVMLLVGSFEPFDKAEARRVGADDILTKPFQSIRNLIDKVGVLVSGRAAEEHIPTAELPHHEPAPEPEKLSEEELQITTADTLPLPDDQRGVVDYYAAKQQAREASQAPVEPLPEMKSSLPQMERNSNSVDVLELDNVATRGAEISDDFVLDLDLDEPAEPSPAVAAYSAPAFLRPKSESAGLSSMRTSASSDQFARTQEFPRPVEPQREAPKPETRDTAPVERMAVAPALPDKSGLDSQNATAQGGALSQETIDAIARRAVEQLSEKVVQEIAWEVVPQLAELMIKRQLEDKNS